MVLKQFNPKTEIIITTDASASGIGAVLYNKIGNQLYAVTCVSATLSTAEAHYPHFEKVALGVILAIKRFYNYIYGKSISILTDPIPVKMLFREKEISSTASPRLQGWCIVSDPICLF